MAYTAWSVVYGEQPTAAKWNQLGANDAGFKDGTNIDAGAILNSHLASGISSAKLSNPHKFSVTKTASMTVPTTAAKVVYNNELFDTGNNYDTSNGRFTAPVAGFYFFEAALGLALGTAQGVVLTLYKNGVTISVLLNNQWSSPGGWSITVGGSAILQLAAGDYIEVYALANPAQASAINDAMRFRGFLISQT